MRAIIVGAGEVGFDVARLLSMEGHDVVVIDKDAAALSNVRERLDVMTVHGNGTSARVLREAGVDGAGILVAVTTVDEVNVVACMLAERLGVGITIARVRSDELSASESVLLSRDFGIDVVIHPEDSAAAEVERLIMRAGASDVIPLADGRLTLVGLRVDADSPVIGRSLIELSSGATNVPFRIAAILRGIRTILPGGTERLVRNDVMFVAAQPKHVPPMLDLMGKKDRRIESVMILGGSEVGLRVARRLGDRRHIRVKLVEPSRERAEHVAELLGDVLVIHGAPTDIDLLVTEGLPEMDAFVAVTDDEESNLVTCLLAKHLGVRKTVALLSKPAYIPISQSIGLDSAVNMKLAVSREVMRHLRGKHVRSVATVHGMDAEIVEFVADARSSITRAPLSELNLPTGMLVAGVVHGKTAEVATGTTRVEAGDHAYVFVAPGVVREVERLFTAG
jgi:trk system potassium uptake protein TrkA